MVHLQPQAYSTLALIIHELVTNSSKYGSLSDSGSVEVTLSVAVGLGLNFKWREVGGPPVKLPTRRGFGLAPVIEAQGAAPPQSTAIASAATAIIKPQPLKGLSVLLVEDNLIVALEAEDLLRALGAASVIMVSSITAASRACEASPIDFAVLDINLGFETSLRFADTLRSAMIPFIFASGYGDQKISDERLNTELTVSKPYDRDYLGIAIANTLARVRPTNNRKN